MKDFLKILLGQTCMWMCIVYNTNKILANKWCRGEAKRDWPSKLLLMRSL